MKKPAPINPVTMPSGKPMDTLSAIHIAENPGDYETEELRDAWQYLLDQGLVWQLQGWYGRTALTMIAAGFIKQKVETGK